MLTDSNGKPYFKSEQQWRSWVAQQLAKVISQALESIDAMGVPLPELVSLRVDNIIANFTDNPELEKQISEDFQAAGLVTRAVEPVADDSILLPNGQPVRGDQRDGPQDNASSAAPPGPTSGGEGGATHQNP